MSAKDFLQKIKLGLSSLETRLSSSVNAQFNQIIKLLLLIGGIFIIVSVVIIFFVSTDKSVKDVSIKSANTINSGKREADFNILMNNEIILPTNVTFDLSCDYVDFMTIKEYTPPKIDMVIKDYQKILEDAIDSELQFGFELRDKNVKKP